MPLLALPAVAGLVVPIVAMTAPALMPIVVALVLVAPAVSRRPIGRVCHGRILDCDIQGKRSQYRQQRCPGKYFRHLMDTLSLRWQETIKPEHSWS
jgi:hypothetical protein